MLEYIVTGVSLGLASGISPGPLLALIISETLSYGLKAGIKVALAILVTDIPIIISAYYFSSQIADFRSMLGIISIMGSGFLLYLASQSFQKKQIIFNSLTEEDKSLRKAILTNLLSPYPYMFWFGVATPIIAKAGGLGTHSVVFVMTFLACLIGSKVMLAIIIARSRRFINGKLYHTINQLLGLVLLGYAFLLLYNGLQWLGTSG